METESQSAAAVMMIRPVRFSFNEETAVDDHFQHKSSMKEEDVQKNALEEFNDYVSILESKGIEVVVFDDTPEPHTPDSIYCNNWISFHTDGTIIVYPMEALDRRLERRKDILHDIERKHHFKVNRIVDISKEEESGRFLEATGSIIFDYVNKKAYASISKRTNLELLNHLAEKLGYEVHSFDSVDDDGVQVYHTNVMMCLGEKNALVCLEIIHNEKEKADLINSLESTNHEVIPLTLKQINDFAGNALEVHNKKGEKFLIMSKRGVDSLTAEQKEKINKYVELVPIPLEVIESNGGGSARCMIADIRLPKFCNIDETK